MANKKKGDRNYVEIETLLEVCRYFEKCGFRFLIYGGWGLDILFGEQTRPHRDIDFFFWRRDYNLLVEAIHRAGWKAFELPGTHVTIKGDFNADIVFLDDPEADKVLGTTSAFRIEVPQRGFSDWEFGSIDSQSFPVGCREMILKLTTVHGKRHADEALIKRLIPGSDSTLMKEITCTNLSYDRSSEWITIEPQRHT